MDRTAAYPILAKALEKHRDLEFADLVARVGQTQSEEILGPSAILYTIDLTFSWKESSHSHLLIHGRIDDQNTFHVEPLEEEILIRNPDYIRKPKEA